VSSIIRHPKDFWAGILFIAFGGGAVLISSDYPIGTAGRMGPGYFPVVLGSLLVLIGLITLGRSFFTKGEPIGKLAIKETVLVIAGILLFGFTVRDAGIVPAVFLVILVSSLASAKFRLLPMLIMAAGSALFCWLAFVYFLGLPLQAFGPWFGY
jgi:hypothetical protein